MPPTVSTITDELFPTEVLHSPVPVVVDFWAAWCPPCRAMDPVLAEMAAERPEIRFRKLNVDDNPTAVAEHGVLSMPTLLVFRGGREVLRLVGARPRGRLARELAEALGPSDRDAAEVA